MKTIFSQHYEGDFFVSPRMMFDWCETRGHSCYFWFKFGKFTVALLDPVSTPWAARMGLGGQRGSGPGGQGDFSGLEKGGFSVPSEPLKSLFYYGKTELLKVLRSSALEQFSAYFYICSFSHKLLNHLANFGDRK